MSGEAVWLRCSYLRSMESKVMGTGSEKKTLKERLLQPDILAHWQLECYGVIFDISRTGSWLNPRLKYNDPTLVENDKRVVFYREMYGTTLLPCEKVHEIGWEEIPEGQYSRFFRNCQTTTKRFAEKIVEKENRNPKFEWPWRSSTVAMFVMGTVASGVATYLLIPITPVVIAVTPDGKMLFPIDWSLGWKFLHASAVYLSKGIKEVLCFHCGDGITYHMTLGMKFFADHFVPRVLKPFLLKTVKMVVGGVAIIYAFYLFAEPMEFMNDHWAKYWAQPNKYLLCPELEKIFRDLRPMGIQG